MTRGHCLALFLALSGPAAVAAQSLGLDPLTDRFAACAGRFAGLMEHQWMQDDPASAASETELDTMHGLLAAVVTPDKAAAALARETEAKLAFERLLKRAASDDGWAAPRAEAEIAACRDLLLD